MSGGAPHTEGRPASERAARYAKQAEDFERLAGMETQPRARTRLLGLAADYRRLADTAPRRPAPDSPPARSWNIEAGNAVSAF